MTDSESPTGRFRITISAWEARMSLWVETPTVLDKATGDTLLSFQDSNWSLDTARWLSESVVELTLRKYPGNHLPANVVVALDCANRSAKIGQTELASLAEVKPALEKALTWRTVDPPRTAPTGCAGILRRFFFGK